jgi:hypothetical protein
MEDDMPYTHELLMTYYFSKNIRHIFMYYDLLCNFEISKKNDRWSYLEINSSCELWIAKVKHCFDFQFLEFF